MFKGTKLIISNYQSSEFDNLLTILYFGITHNNL